MFCLFVGALYKWNVTKTKFLCTFKCHWRIKYPCIFVFIHFTSSLFLLLLFCVSYNSSPEGFYLSKFNILFIYLFIHSHVLFRLLIYCYCCKRLPLWYHLLLYLRNEPCVWNSLPASVRNLPTMSSKLSSRLHRLDGPFHKSMYIISADIDYVYVFVHVCASMVHINA